MFLTKSRTLCLALTTFVLANVQVKSYSSADSIDDFSHGDYMMVPYDVGNVEGENIDPRTLSVHWQTVDLALPGNGGLDIVVSRTFGGLSTDNGPLAKQLGGWSLDTPHIFIQTGPAPGVAGDNSGDGACGDMKLPGDWRWVQEYSYETNMTVWETVYTPGFKFSGPASLVLPQSQPRVLLTKNASATQFPASAEYVTEDNFIVECSGDGSTFIARSPAGIKYFFDVRSNVHGDYINYLHMGYIVFSVSRVEDLNGNWLEYDYHPEHDGFYSLKKITSNDGRLVEFSYANVTHGQLTKVESNNRQVGYSYALSSEAGTREYLSRVDLPEGLSWQYQTNGPFLAPLFNRALTQVILPTGGIVDYEYATSFDYNGGSRKRLEKRLASGSDVPTGVWTYTYNESQLYERINIYSPTRWSSLEFHRGFQSAADYEVFELEDPWKAGRLKSARIGRLPHIGGEQQIDYEYAELPEISEKTIAGPRIGEHQIRPVRATKITVTDPLTLSTFVTENSGYTPYAYPASMVETGTQSRTKNYTYSNQISNWIVGQIDQETIVGIGTIDNDYNEKGQLIKRDEYGIVRAYEYHPSGDLWKEKWHRDAQANEIVYTDYFRGTAQREDHPQDVTIKRKINATGTTQWEEDGEGNRTVYGYDDLDRLILVDTPADTPTEIDWLSPRQTLLRKGRLRIKTTLDGFGRPIHDEQWDTSWPATERIFTRTLYDADGRMIFDGDPSNSLSSTEGVSYEHDRLGRITTMTNTADNSTLNYCYGDPCDVASQSGVDLVNGYIVTDERGYETVFEHQSFGRPETNSLIKISKQIRKDTEPGGLKFIDIVMTRNALGNILTATQTGVVRQYQYYPNQLLYRVIEPETGITQIGYDSIGNRKSVKVGASSTTYFEYDDLNRMKAVNYPAGTPDISYQYFKTGDVKIIENGNTEWSYTYDNNNRLKTESLKIGTESFDFAYDYDSIGALESMTYPSGSVVGFNPDAFGRPTKVGSYVTQASYHPTGHLSSLTYGNGHQLSISLTSRNYADVIWAGDDIQQLFNYDYEFDGIGNILRIDDVMTPSRTKILGYDGDSRLVSALGSWGLGSFDYDDRGNIESKAVGSTSLSYLYDPSNRLATISGSVGMTMSYDAYGNITDNGTNQFNYNDASQLTAVPTIPGVSYQYDALGFRAVANRPDETQYYAYGSNKKLLYSKNITDNANHEYFYLGSRLVAKRDYGSGVDDDLDNDGIPDDVELQLGLNPSIPDDGAGDLDGDGASNSEEYQARTLLNNADSDGDGMPDGYEIEYGLDGRANDADNDADGDGLTNLQEVALHTNPNNADTDNDGVPDNLDSTPSFNPALIPILTNILL